MDKVYEVVSKEVSKGKVFPNQEAFLAWMLDMAGRRKVKMLPSDFYASFETLVARGDVNVIRSGNSIRVKLGDKA